jgi:hypothetical protein
MFVGCQPAPIAFAYDFALTTLSESDFGSSLVYSKLLSSGNTSRGEAKQ